MLLTISAQSLWESRKPRKGVPDPLSLPAMVRDEFAIGGLTLHTGMLAGWEAPLLERFRDEADKAGCPCLLLVEPTPQALGDRDSAKSESAFERVDRVLRAAHRLGCSSVALSIANPGDASLTEGLVQRLKQVIGRAERLEINLLLSPCSGLTETPDGLTALIRKVGGFRIGSFPDFQTAAAGGDPVPYLRGLAPYANAVCASILDFDAAGRHKAFDLELCVKAIRAVGFDSTLTLEYRGKGDPIPALRAARGVIESCLSDGPAEDSDE